MKDKLTVFIDIGHGPNNSASGKLDPGAVDSGSGATEYGIARDIANEALALYQELEAPSFELVVVPELSRTGVANHVNLHAKNRPNSILLSLHMNASKHSAASGTEVIIAGSHKKLLMPAAITIGVAFSGKVTRVFRGVKADTQIPASYVTILRLAKIPAFLIEMGFIGNNSDLAAVRRDGAAALLAAIHAYQGFLENQIGKD